MLCWKTGLKEIVEIVDKVIGACNIGQGYQVKVFDSVHRGEALCLVAVGLIVEEISNVDVKCVKVTAAQNIGQGHSVKVSAESVHSE